MKKSDQIEWGTTYFCEKPRRSSPKESVLDISNLILILDVIVVL